MSEQRLIDAKAYADELWKMRQNYQMLDDTHTADKIMHGIFRAEQALKEQPTVDAVPIGVLEQIRWERDVAMQQLAEHGIPFGGVADDVVKVIRCKDCDMWHKEVSSGRKSLGNYRCLCDEWSDYEDGRYRYTGENDFCSYGEKE